MYEGKNALVVGTGLSGEGAVKLLHSEGAATILLEQNTKLTEDDVRGKLDKEDRDYPEVIVGDLPKEKLQKLDVAVLSPAVPLDSPIALALKAAGVPILSEIELGYRFEKGKFLAITGTNGKTTTTTLIGEIMKAYNPKTFVVGNIGFSYAAVAKQTSPDSVSVGEISSFQLEGTDTFHPQVAAILNITPDHLNRHYTMENYAAIKERISFRQTPEDTCVLNYEDKYLRPFGEHLCHAKVVWFSSKQKVDRGCYLDGNDIYMADESGTRRLMDIHDMKLVGICNVENVMAAIAVTSAAGVPMDTILSVIHDFPPVEHRIEYVATKGGVMYYNDSKATNPDAAIQGIKAMDRPTVLIGGGYDKKNTYDEWIQAFDGKVKELVLIGQTAQAIAQTARKYGVTNITFCDTFDQCLKHCTEAAAPGDAVLLSPACASWGMFPNYEVRGNMFKDYVHSLPD